MMKDGIIRGAVSLSGARIAINLLSAASIALLARLLTPDDFAIIALGSSVLSVVVSLTELYFTQALMQPGHVSDEQVHSAWTLSLIRAVLIIALCVALAWPLAAIFNEPRLVAVVVISGITGAFMGFYNPLINLATKELSFRAMVIFQVAQKALGLALVIVLALIYENYWSIVIGNAVGAVGGSLLSYFLIPYRPRFSLKHAKNIWGFSSWMFYNQILETIGWRFDQLAIGFMLPKKELGIYSLADNLAVIPSRELSGPLNVALLSGMASMSDDVMRLRKSYMRSQSTIAMAVLPLVIGLGLLADPAVRVMLGSQWLACVPFVSIFAFTYALSLLNTSLRPLALALGATKSIFERQLCILCLKVPLISIGLMFYGTLGAALGALIAGVVSVGIDYGFSRTLLGIPMMAQLRSHTQTFAGLAVMAATVVVADDVIGLHDVASPIIRLLILSVLGGIAFVGGAVATWAAEGRKDGPVCELSGILSGMLGKLRGTKQALPSI